jgi:hypothetical protein
MRRSAHVFAPLLAATAVALTGCHHAEPERCVDEQNHVVDPKFCADLPPGGQQSVTGSPGNGGGYAGNNGIFFPHIYRYYYGGGGGFTPGAIVTGGSFAPIAGHSYSTSVNGTSRGGFGSSFSEGSSAHSSSGGGE